jgi:hypothetical protein
LGKAVLSFSYWMLPSGEEGSMVEEGGSDEIKGAQ